MLDRPIMLLGAARSGTTLLADTALGLHPDVAYWGEPRFVWRAGHAYRASDVLTAADATPAVRRRIRERFERFRAERADGRPGVRFAEKTPSLCFGVPFARAVLPGARFVHLVRDGRDVAASAAREWQGRGDAALDSPELRRGGALQQIGRGVRRWAQLGDRIVDLRTAAELPASAGRVAGFAARRLGAPGADRIPWGPRFPGLGAVRRRHSLVVTTAVQWARSAEAARRGAAGLGDRYLELRYEDLIRDPAATLARALDAWQLDAPPGLVRAMAARVVARPAPSWPSAMSPADVGAVEAAVGPTLRAFGYALSGDADG